MSLSVLFLLAVASTATLAVARVVRVHYGRPPLPEVGSRLVLVLAFLVVPPLALGAVVLPAHAGRLDGIVSVPAYSLLVAGIVLLMAFAAPVVLLVAPPRLRSVVLLALVGGEGDRDEVPFDPPLTAELAESVAIVERANAAFPRGPEFPIQIERPGFRVAWDALDEATVVLEGRVADDRRLGVPVASKAGSLAVDARSRLDTLRRLALVSGQAWAG